MLHRASNHKAAVPIRQPSPRSRPWGEFAITGRGVGSVGGISQIRPRSVKSSRGQTRPVWAPTAPAGTGLFQPDEWELPDLAVAVLYFDPPPIPDGHVILLQVMDDLQGLHPGRRVVSQKLCCFEANEPVTVAERKLIEGHTCAG